MKPFPKRLMVPLFLIVLSVILSACGGGSTTLTVNSNNDADDGVCNSTHCSLREAINKGNTLSGTITIAFNIGGGGPQTIQPTYGLPMVTAPMTIDGSTQPGYVSTPLIELDGILAITLGGDAFFDGLAIIGGKSTVKALAINRFEGNGIRLSLKGENRILGCYIGTDRTGMNAAGNGTQTGSLSAGILINSGDENTIGGTGALERNVISGNLDAGIRILTNGNTVIDNYIGIDAAGTGALGNHGNGVLVAGGENRIGGQLGSTGNVISANLKNGVSISGATNDVKGNLIGLNAAGTAGLGNHENGVLIGANLTLVGGTSAGEGNIISDNFLDGIGINADSVEVAGNFIGTNRAGTAAVGNHRNGVFIMSQGGVLVGGTDAGARNVISGNGIVGIWIEDGSNDVTVYGNRIGTNAAGTAALKNIKSGMHVSGTNHQIGASGKGNLISGNGGAGISVVSPATGIVIQDNRIGTDADGHLAVGNDIGIEIGLSAGAYDVLIGGSIYGEGNLISGNLQEGLLLYNNAKVYGNMIGMDQSGLNELPNGGDGILVKGDNNLIGTPHEPNSIAHNGGHGVAVITESGSATGNFIDGNNIWDNAGLGIALGGDTVLANDPGDPDAGDNNLQNYPLMSSAVHDPIAGQTALSAQLDSAPLTQYTVEFFTNTSCDPSGYGEGEQMVASATVTTDAGGHADVTALYDPIHFIAGSFITVTATDPAGDTSEFSNCIPITEKGAVTETPTPAAMVFEPTVNPLEIFYGNCEPNTVQITVDVFNSPKPIGYVLLFVRLMDKKTGEKTNWSEGLTMIGAGKNRFYYDLSSFDVPDYTKFEDAWLQYQFVVYDGDKNKLGTSEVFGNISFKRCGRVPGVAG